MEQTKIDRINALARKAKSEGLTPEEITERDQLRAEYIHEFRFSMRSQLESTVIQYPDGTKVPVKSRKTKQ